jgi:hypothetical protein
VDTSHSEGFKASYSVPQYEDFIQHPLLLSHYHWTPTSTASVLYTDLFATYLATASANPLGYKLNNFRFISGDLKITVVVQGMPFAQGLLLLAFDPTPIPSGKTKTGSIATNVQPPPQKVRGRYLPHILVDPSKSQTYELVLKCPTVWGVWDRAQSLGSYSLSIIPYNALGSGTSTAPAIGLCIYASLVNPVMTGISYTSGSLAKKEQDPKLSSKIRDAGKFVSKVAEPFKSIPYIGAGVTLFSDITETASSFLSWFGYSRPMDLEIQSAYLSTTVPSLTNIDAKFEARNLAMRQINSVGFTDDMSNISSMEDQMIDNLLMREGLIYQYQIPTTATSQSLLFTIPVTTGVIFPSDSPVITGQFEPTTVAYISSMFKYWRGDINYRFEIVASVFTRTTIMIAYCPLPPASTISFSTALQSLRTWQLQVSGNSELEIVVPWSQPQANAFTTNCRSASNLLPTLTTSNPQNGVLLVYLVNAVTTNGSTDGPFINLFISSSNLELGVPSLANVPGVVYTSGTIAPVTTSKYATTTDEHFYKRFFGESKPNTVKELASRISPWASINDTTTGTPKSCLAYYLPIFQKTSSANLVLTTDWFLTIASMYVGYRGSLNFTLIPDVNPYAFTTVGDGPSWGMAMVANGIESNLESDGTNIFYNLTGENYSIAYSNIQSNIPFVFPYYNNQLFEVNAQQDTGFRDVINLSIQRTFSSTDYTLSPMVLRGAGDDSQFCFFIGIPMSA